MHALTRCSKCFNIEKPACQRRRTARGHIVNMDVQGRHRRVLTPKSETNIVGRSDDQTRSHSHAYRPFNYFTKDRMFDTRIVGALAIDVAINEPHQ